MRIILTGPAGGGSEGLARELRTAGFEVVECPLIRIEPLEGPPLRLGAYDWVVLTSRNGVEHFFRRVDGPLAPVAVIGPGTAEALRAHGVEPALVAAHSTQEGLVQELRARMGLAPGRVLFAGAEGARDVLVRELGAEFVPLYRTVEQTPRGFPAADLVLLASPSAARALTRVRRDVPCVSIGPVTSAAARDGGLDVVAEAESQDLGGLVAAVKLAASNLASSPS